jgi:hypothetical protein
VNEVDTLNFLRKLADLGLQDPVLSSELAEGRDMRLRLTGTRGALKLCIVRQLEANLLLSVHDSVRVMEVVCDHFIAEVRAFMELQPQD